MYIVRMRTKSALFRGYNELRLLNELIRNPFTHLGVILKKSLLAGLFAAVGLTFATAVFAQLPVKMLPLAADVVVLSATVDSVDAKKRIVVLKDANGKVGAVGFCYGGGIVNYLATQLPDLAAAVPFYGSQPSAEDTKKIKAPLLIHYAGADERINAGWPAYEDSLKAAGVRYEAFIYEGVQHGFNNDTTPRFDAAAASLAWQRTIRFFNDNLRT